MKFLTLTSFLNLSNFLSDIVSKKKKKRSDYNQIRSAGKIYKIIRQYSKYISIATEVPDKHLNKQIKYKMHIFFFYYLKLRLEFENYDQKCHNSEKIQSRKKNVEDYVIFCLSLDQMFVNSVLSIMIFLFCLAQKHYYQV